jgi:hypothetical protein
MRTLSILTTAAGILLAISGPSLAASRTQTQHKATDAYSAYAHDVDNAFWPAPYVYAPGARAPYGSTYGVQERGVFNPFGPGRDLPYPDRPRNDW